MVCAGNNGKRVVSLVMMMCASKLSSVTDDIASFISPFMSVKNKEHAKGPDIMMKVGCDHKSLMR
jgi:hypothetical protein